MSGICLFSVNMHRSNVRNTTMPHQRPKMYSAKSKHSTSVHETTKSASFSSSDTIRKAFYNNILLLGFESEKQQENYWIPFHK